MSVRNKKKTFAATGASLALAAALIGGGLSTASASAWAAPAVPGFEQVRQATPSPEPKPKPARGGQNERRGGGMQHGQMQEAYLNALAGRLGLTVDQLKAAMKQSRIDLINKAVAEGKLDQERANRMIQAIESGQRPGQQGQQGQGQRGQGPGQGQRGPGIPGPGQAIAEFLGMTPEQLRTESQAGKSLAQIAEAKGITRDALKAKILELHKTRLDAAVASGRMTADQAKQALDRMTANVDRMLDATPGQRRQPRGAGTGG
jgi:polyhydroxyalkanoate synthesis regulator phasin